MLPRLEGAFTLVLWTSPGDRRPRPQRLPAPLPRSLRARGRARRMGDRFGNARPRRGRRTVRPRDRAGRDGRDRRRRLDVRSARSRTSASIRGCASSSSSTSHAPTAASTAARCTLRASGWASSSPPGARGRRSRDAACPTPEFRRPRASPARSGIPFGQGLVKNRYIGRTFIAPDRPEARTTACGASSTRCARASHGKRLVVVDDSIVRGTTTRQMVRMLREAGATEVHLRISSPPFGWPCFYGIDTPYVRRAAGGERLDRRDSGLLGVGLAGLPVARRTAGGDRRRERRVLLGMSHRRIPGGSPL